MCTLQSDITQFVAHITPEQKKRWPQHFPQLLFAYKTSVHSSTGISPYELMFWRKPLLPIDSLLGLSKEMTSGGTAEDWVQEHHMHLHQHILRHKLNWKPLLEHNIILSLCQFCLLVHLCTGEVIPLVVIKSKTSGSLLYMNKYNAWMRLGYYTRSSPRLSQAQIGISIDKNCAHCQ